MAYVSGKRVGTLVELMALALVSALALAACGTATTSGSGGAYGGTSPTNTPGASAQINLTCAPSAIVCTKTVTVSGKTETVLANSAGMTLYYFTPDTATTIACSGACAQTWPPLTASGSGVTGSGLSGTLTTLNGANGKQVEYNGHPLYTYAGDHAQTDANGEGVGGKWFVAVPGLATTGAPAPAASPTSGGYGAGGY